MPKLKKKSETQKRETDKLRKRSKKNASQVNGCQNNEVRSNNINPAQIIGTSEEGFGNINPNEVLDSDLSIQVVDYVSQILKAQYNCQYGMMPPSYLYHLQIANDDLNVPNVPCNVEASQIHYVTNHFIVSAQKNGQLYVYDSLPNQKHLDEVKAQLKMIYDDIDNQVNYVTPQFQGSTVLCGFFAIANAVTCLQGNDPCSKHFLINHMRIHLRNCIANGILSDFPHINTQQTKYHHSSVPLSEYFRDQRNKQCTKDTYSGKYSASKRIEVSPITNASVKQQRNTKAQTLKRQDESYRAQIRKRETMNRKRKRQDDEYKSTECRRETSMRQSKRQDSDYKFTENVRETSMRQSKRQDSDYKSIENVRETSMRRDKRQDSEYKSTENVRETPMRQSKRQDSDYKAAENVRETLIRKDKRQNSDYKSTENVRDTSMRQSKRQDSDYKAAENVRETLMRKDKRQNSDYKSTENVRETSMRQSKRQDSDYKAVENVRETLMRKDKRQNSDYKSTENVRETSMRQSKRQDSDYKAGENVRETLMRKDKRQNSDYKAAENVRETSSRISKRQDPVYKMREITRETHRRKLKRSNEYYRRKERLIYLKYRRSKRMLNTCGLLQKKKHQKKTKTKIRLHKKSKSLSIEQLIHKFHVTVSQGPVYVCATCSQLHYKHSVVKLKSSLTSKIINSKIQDVVHKCVHFPASGMKTVWVCKTCMSYLKKGKVPPSSEYNKMILPPQGTLKDLNILELSLLAPVLPFMKIHQAPRGKQLKINGNMVLVPSNVKNSVTSLPRLHAETATIKATLKRRLRYKHHIYSLNIRPDKIRNALSYLSKTSKLYKDHNITFNEHFVDDHILPTDSDKEECIDSENEESSANTNVNMCTPSLTQNNFSCDKDLSKIFTGDDNDSDSDNWSEIDPTERSPGTQDTMLTSPDFVESSERDYVYNFAPAEGNIPVSVFMEPNAEELSFPGLFCGHARPENERTVPVTYSQIVKSELRNSDRKAASCVENIFFKTKKIQMKQLIDQTQLVVRKYKTKGKTLTAKDVKGESVKEFIYKDKAYKLMAKLRGSPPYFQAVSKDLFAMIRQLGPATFFCSLSAAETRWPHLLCILSKVVLNRRSIKPHLVRKVSSHSVRSGHMCYTFQL